MNIFSDEVEHTLSYAVKAVFHVMYRKGQFALILILIPILKNQMSISIRGKEWSLLDTRAQRNFT